MLKSDCIKTSKSREIRPRFTTPKETGNFYLLLYYSSTVMLRNVWRCYPNRSVFVLRVQQAHGAPQKKSVYVS